MKSLKSWSLRLRLLGLSAIITLICVVAGGFITRSLMEREKDFNRRMRPHDRNPLIIRELISTTQLSAPEAFKVVEKHRSNRAPYQVYLLNSQKKILDYFPKDAEGELDLKEAKIHEVADGFFVAYNDNPFHQMGPPPGAQLVGIVAVAVSILVGLGLSIIFLTMFVRGKSKQAEIVIGKLRSGDLKARFKINQVDESSQLMEKFNDMADQIEELVSNLRSTEKARMILLQELAHDLRTPVASLKNLQELLLDKGHLMEEDKRRHAQELAVKEVYYFERLVEDLLFLSGVNDPRYSAHFQSLSMTKLIEEEADIFETDKIHLTIHADMDVSLLGDDHLLRRMMKNALSNASRFARSNIQITATKDESGVTVTILDDGPGLDPSQLLSFGEKKYSRHLQEASDNISIGLGSVIMKKIVSLHNGEMKVQNDQTKGLKLIFHFPNR